MRIVVEIVISESATISPEPSARAIKAAALVKCQPRLPTFLAHPLKDNRAVVIHALGPSPQGSRQNCSEPCRLLPADIPGCGFVVITTRRFCSINARAPFDYVEVYLQNAMFAEDGFGYRYQCGLRALAEDRAARSEE